MLFGDTWNERTVEVFGPLGRAVFDPAEERSFLAVAGGSGIAGILAILDRAGQADGFLRRHPSRVFFGLREPDTAYGLDDLACAVSGAEGGLAVTVAFSHAPPTAALASRYPELTFGSGFVHDVARDALASRPAPADAMHFVAGPPAMVDATMRALVVELKVKPTEIRYDRFG
jgi:toluene monooxygenase electron transfer component